MATILKCKMCGGDIEVNADMSVGTCIYCGSTMTLPHIDSDKKARLFNMANQYRLNNEFDKAYEAYRDIVSEDEQESEAYWGMILSEYGVEYVEDPKTKHRIPTCHRTIAKPVKSSVNYDMAYKYADAERRMMYSDEADIINSLQQRILSVSSKIEPYDVFICYKETEDETGERTQDSVIAQDIYNELEKQGLKTFFARISLESVLGQDYEPYIYAALHSAKVMLMVSTKQEHCNAVWVKNEWNRYIGFMEEDENKSIIPVYKDMSPYEFPYELTKYQAQDMSKIGAVQDLVTGVKKLCGRTVMQANNETINMLLKEKEEREEEKAREKAKQEKRKKTKKKVIKRIVISLSVIAGLIICIRIAYKPLITPIYYYYTMDSEDDETFVNYYEVVNNSIVKNKISKSDRYRYGIIHLKELNADCEKSKSTAKAKNFPTAKDPVKTASEILNNEILPNYEMSLVTDGEKFLIARWLWKCEQYDLSMSFYNEIDKESLSISDRAKLTEDNIVRGYYTIE